MTPPVYIACVGSRETPPDILAWMEAVGAELDIAVRNVLLRLGRSFASGKPVRLLQIRSKDSDGYRFGPGNVPFFVPAVITQPSLAPEWAKRGSVEDVWQSNKWLCVRS